MITIKTQVSANDKLLQNYFAERFCRALMATKMPIGTGRCTFHSDDPDAFSLSEEQRQLLEKAKKGEFPRFFVMDTYIFEIGKDILFIGVHSEYPSQEEAIKTLESFHVDYFVITDKIAEKYFS